MAGDTAAIIQVIDICIVSDRSVRGPGVLNIPPTSYLAPIVSSELMDIK